MMGNLKPCKRWAMLLRPAHHTMWGSVGNPSQALSLQARMRNMTAHMGSWVNSTCVKLEAGWDVLRALHAI